MNTTPIRVALAGTRGHWRHALEEATAAGATVAAIADCGDDAAPALRWAAEHGSPGVARFADLVPMLAAAGRPDLLVVCGPFERHAEMCIAAIALGIPVLTEKPAALSDGELDALRDACAARPDVPLCGMMFSRYEPAFFAARQLIERGAIGDVRLMNLRKSYRLGKRGGYFTDRATYGGTIPWVGSHAVDWAHGFLGAAPRRVYASHSTVANDGNGSMEVTASILMEYADGVTATASVDVLRPAAASSHGDDWARVVGTRGVLECREGRLDVIDANGPQTIAPADPKRTLVGDLIAHLRGGPTPWVDTRATLELTATLLAARRSADEGRLVDVTL